MIEITVTNTRPALAHCHFKPTPIQSAITGRTVYVSETKTQFAILPGFTPARLAAAKHDWDSHAGRFRRPDKSPTALGLSVRAQGQIAALFESNDLASFGAAVSDAVAYMHAFMAERAASEVLRDKFGRSKGRKKRGPQAKRILEALTILWKHGLLVFPAGELWSSGAIQAACLPDISARLDGPLAEATETMRTGVRFAGQRRPIALLFKACGGAVEVGDVDGAVMRTLSAFAPVPAGNVVYGMCDRLHAMQEHVYRDDRSKADHIPQSYRAFFKRSAAPRSDVAFRWAVEAGGQRLEDWRVAATMYSETLPNRVSLRPEIAVLNALLDYVIAEPTLPRTPLEYCRRDYTPPRTYAQYLAAETGRNETGRGQMLSMAERFFDWILETQATDDEGVLLRAYRNPIDDGDIPIQAGSKGQTHRSAIPLKYIRMMREIIEENDFAWPKTLASDYMTWLNPETGLVERVWSPVRANYYLLRLMLPIRGLQARLLDSGEADATVYRPELGGWVPNTGRWAPADGERREPQCLVRQIWDHVHGRHYNGLFITTNKTQDRQAAFTDSGYEIPWEHQEVIDLFCRVRDWQERYNPLRRPMTRAELSDPRLVVSKDVAGRLERLAFLFRDAADPAHPQEPPSDGRLTVFWRMLVAELERRLDTAKPEPIRNSDGSKIVLVTSWSEREGHPRATIFDPHSLRVGGLTALAAAGVPLHVLSEFVAGHATVLMTLYYNKLNAAEITRVLDEALEKLPRLEQRNWDAHIHSMPLDLVHEVAAYNSDDGLHEAQRTQSALWALMDDGFCPNGATKCSSGGPPIATKKGDRHGPVPGGPRNCALCRFFVTGPAFLAGQVAKFNATAGAIREALLRLQQRTRDRAQLLKAKLDAERAGQAYGDRNKLDRLEEVLDGINAEIDVLASCWAAQHVLIKRSEAILNAEMCGARGKENALVLTGDVADFRAALEECSEFDLLDRICQDSEVHAGVNAQVPALRRGRLLDAMLAREGQPAVFATLSDDQLVAVGNAATRFLRTRLGRPDTNALIAGEKTLTQLGLSATDVGLLRGEPVPLISGLRTRALPVLYTAVEVNP